MKTNTLLNGAARMTRAAVAVAAVVAVAGFGGCGGGGVGTPGVVSAPPDPTAGLVPSASVAQHCAAPRAGDTRGTVADEKSWVRSWVDETYLWYRDVRGLPAATLDASRYGSATAFFAALKSPQITASGKPRDQFHFTYDTPTWVALSQSGTSFGYGFDVELIASVPPRQAVVAYTDPNTPASANGVNRGAQLLTVDGVDIANGSDVAALNAGLFPTAAGPHVFTVRDVGAANARSVTLNAAALASPPVQSVKTLAPANPDVGYMLFNDHLATSEAPLVAAITQLKAAGVRDLVLDIRYNGGGYLDIASELAYMIAGPGPTTGKVFEQESYNDKNPFQLTTAQRTTPFLTTGQGFSVASGQALPTLGLSRVFVLAGPGTCSASEAIVNGLRGVGVQVKLIGEATCGKPYGFYPQDNCNTTYFSIQFQGVNQIGFGDYADGFTPDCSASDDFAHALGDPAEGRLAAALYLRANSACKAGAGASPGTSTALRARVPADAAGLALQRPAVRENRIYRGS